jgi:hypothetical protein
MTTPNERSDLATNPFAPLLDFRFTQFITVRIIQVLYLVGIVIIALYTLAGVIGVFQAGAVKGILALILSPLVFLISVLILRVYLEIIAVLFRIADNTSRLVNNAERPRTP